MFIVVWFHLSQMSLLSWFGLGQRVEQPITEDTTKFLEFFPSTCANCKVKTEKLFECLSSKSAEYLKETGLEAKLTAPSKVTKECENDLIAYNVCMIKDFRAKNRPYNYHQQFRVRFFGLTVTLYITLTFTFLYCIFFRFRKSIVRKQVDDCLATMSVTVL